MFVTWTDELTVGIDRIDRDHQILFDLIDQFHEAYSRGAASDSLPYVFETLIEYIGRHFKDEEDLMFAHGYPQAEAHKQIHQVIAQEVEGLHCRFQRGETSEVCIEMLGLMSNWWHFHIMDCDQGYHAYFKEKGITP